MILFARFVWLFLSHSRIVHSFGNIIITGECPQIFDLCSALMAIEQWGFFTVPFPLKHRLNWPSPIISDPHTAEWSCHHLFLRLRSIATGVRTPNLSACDMNCTTAAVTVPRLKDNNPLVTLWSSTRESNLENFKICHFRINK